MSSEIVVAAYAPKPGREAALRDLLARHVPTLWDLGLVTNRAPVVARAANGTYVEVFEWKSELSADEAHEHPVVAKVWEAIAQAADVVALGSLPEAREPFPRLTPVDLGRAPRVYRIALPIDDIERATAFYRALLGVAGARVCPTRHNFACDGVVLALVDPRGDGERYDPAAQAAMVYFTVPDVDAVFARARTVGFAELDPAVADQPWGEGSFYGRDPFGNRLAFVAEATTGV